MAESTALTPEQVKIMASALFRLSLRAKRPKHVVLRQDQAIALGVPFKAGELRSPDKPAILLPASRKINGMVRVKFSDFETKVKEAEVNVQKQVPAKP